MDPEDLTFSDFLPTIAKLGKGEWTTVYSSRDSLDGVAIYSALIKSTLVKRALQRPSWDLTIGDGAPGLESSFGAGKERTRYVRSSDSGIEPLVLKRSFHEIRPGYWEVSEDFRLYFNLYDDKLGRKLLRIDDNGDQHEAVLMKDPRRISGKGVDRRSLGRDPNGERALDKRRRNQFGNRLSVAGGNHGIQSVQVVGGMGYSIS